MIIWGRPMAMELYQVLEDIRQELERDPFPRTQNSGADIFVTCPNIEGHGGIIERTPSCSINKENGMVHCFGCGYSDSLPGLIAKLFKLPNKVAGYRWLLKRYSIPIKSKRPKLKLSEDPRIKVRSFLPDEALLPFNYDHPYMFRRGLTIEVIDLFEIGYDKVTNSITIPMRDHMDRLVFIKKRPINKTKGKYHIDLGTEKRDIIYGMNIIRNNISRVKMLYLCEGEFDTMSFYVSKLYGAGLQGSKLYDEQLKLLIQICRGLPLCLFFDNDAAGRKCMRESIPKLRPYFPLYKPESYYNLKDPNEILLARGTLSDIRAVPIF